MVFSERLKHLMDVKNLSPADFSREVGFQESMVSKWLTGRTKQPYRKTIQKISNYFGCNINWLETGEGKPFPIKDHLTDKKIAESDRKAIKQLRHPARSMSPPGEDHDYEKGYIETPDQYEREPEYDQSHTRDDEIPMVRMYRQLAEMDADTLGEIQTWLNDMERYRPGFTGWFRLEFQNRFPEFDEWKNKIVGKSNNGTADSSEKKRAGNDH